MQEIRLDSLPFKKIFHQVSAFYLQQAGFNKCLGVKG
jgi:hypothetical protein